MATEENDRVVATVVALRRAAAAPADLRRAERNIFFFVLGLVSFQFRDRLFLLSFMSWQQGGPMGRGVGVCGWW